jgi:thioredoxin-related protein
MKKLILVVSGILTMSFVYSQTIFENAKKDAGDHHKLILLNFSGSDWCIPCIKMHKEIFENDGFKNMSDSLLVIINADFPRNKKSQQDISIRKQNEELADKYNPNGAFPYTLLLNSDGKILKAWEGLPKGDAASFSDEVRAIYINTYN